MAHSLPATLLQQYEAASHDLGTPGGSTKQESGRCTATLAAQVRVPWRLGLQLLGPPASHTLLAAAAPAKPGVGGGSGGADLGVLLAEQARRLQSLGIQDSTAAAAAPDLGAVADSRDLALHLLHGLPPRFALPAGQRCTALVQLQSQAACQLDVLAIELEAAEGLAAAAATAAAKPAAGTLADTLNKSDIYTRAFSLASATSAPTELPSLGFLRLRWRRSERRPPSLSAAARGGSQLSAAEAEAAIAALDRAAAEGGSGRSSGTAAAASAAPPCEVLLPLPAVSLLQPLLSAEVRNPPAATAGTPIEVQLLLHNSGGTSQEVAVAVGDPHGFLLAGGWCGWDGGKSCMEACKQAGCSKPA